MAGEAILANTTILELQQALQVVATVGLLNYLFHPTSTPTNNTCYDFIVCGHGTAGSVIASRLTENSDTTVLVLDAGPYPPLESSYPAVFTLLPSTAYEWNMTTVNDYYTAQNGQGGVLPLTVGNMDGGSSSVNHMLWVHGVANDYAKWVAATNDSSWAYDELLKYIQLSEDLQDTTLLSSSSSAYHGVGGNIALTREPSASNAAILKALNETLPLLDDITGHVYGVNEPLLTISNGIRQSHALAYMSVAKNRSNLYVVREATVTKVNIDSNNATGVTWVNSDGETMYACANKEVIVSAGALKSPQILMLSGVGPASHLNSLDIPVVADLQVGQGLMDHFSSPLLVALEESTEATPDIVPGKFPVPMSTCYVVLNETTGQTYPDYQSINLLFPHDSSGFLQLCLNVFKYSTEMCQTMFTQAAGRTVLWGVVNGMSEKSRGSVLLNSASPTDSPLINLGLFNDTTDMKNMGLYLADLDNRLNTTSYYQEVGGEVLQLGLCPDYTFRSAEYWECYVLAMGSTMWHYSGTCAMGTVLDSQLRVIGIPNLRVIDASSMPAITSGNIAAPITFIAEKGAALIKETWGIS